MFKLFDLSKSDLIRYAWETCISVFAIQYITNKIFRLQVAFCFEQTDGVPRLVSHFLRMINRNESIAKDTKFGYGLYIGHNRLVVVNPTAAIEDAIKLSRFATIGSDEGHATKTWNNVYADLSTCVVENMKIGNTVTIKEGTVVPKDIPSAATAAGNYCRGLNYCRPVRFIVNRWTIKS